MTTMLPNLFTGHKVRLAAQNPETDPELYARWTSDPEYLRFLEGDPVRPLRAQHYKQMLEKHAEREGRFVFSVRTLAEDKLIGFTNLWVWSWTGAHGGVGIGMGDPEYRGRGYGTDAMQLVLRYAFNELNLERMTLQAVAHNPRAIRSYEKAGYVLVGLEREADLRDGARNGIVTMTIARADWTNTLGDTLVPYIHAFDKPAASAATEPTP